MTTTMNRRGFLGASAAVAAFAGLGFPVRAQDSGNLLVTTYGGRYETFWREVLLPAFEAKTGIAATLDLGAGGKWAADLRTSNRETPPYSYVMTNEIVGEILRTEGYFTPWDKALVPNMASVHPKALVADGAAVTAMVSPIGIAYRTDLVSNAPTSWADLWTNDEIRGMLGLYSMQNTAGFMFVMMVSQIFGSGPFDFDAGFAKIEELGSFVQGDLSGAISILLSRGEVSAAVLDLSEVLNLRSQGIPVDFVAPAEGMFYFDQTFSLVENGPAPEAASAFLDLMLDADIQERLAAEFSAIPVRGDVALPEAMTELGLSVDSLDSLVTFDWAEANSQRDQVAERWNRLAR